MHQWASSGSAPASVPQQLHCSGWPSTPAWGTSSSTWWLHPAPSSGASYYQVANTTSRDATAVLRDAIRDGAELNVNDHNSHCRSITQKASRNRDVHYAEVSQRVIAELPISQRRTVSRIVQGNASGWLTVLPLKQEGYDLSSVEFRDQLAIRYGHEPAHLPSSCDGCGDEFTLQHGLDCQKGGLVKRGHDDLRDSDAKLAELAFGGVRIEPVVVPADDHHGRPALRADWSARGVWDGNQVALFDNRIVDADAPGCLTLTPTRGHKFTTSVQGVCLISCNDPELFCRTEVTSHKARTYSNTTKRCNLCTAEKFWIITADKTNTLNRRSELVSTCRHSRKFLLSNFTPAVT